MYVFCAAEPFSQVRIKPLLIRSPPKKTSDQRPPRRRPSRTLHPTRSLCIGCLQRQLSLENECAGPDRMDLLNKGGLGLEQYSPVGIRHDFGVDFDLDAISPPEIDIRAARGALFKSLLKN